MNYQLRTPTDAYANYGKYFVKFNKSLLTFSLGYEGKGEFLKNVSLMAKKGKNTLAFGSVTTKWSQPNFNDFTMLTVTYEGETSMQVNFKVTRNGIYVSTSVEKGYAPIFNGEIDFGKIENNFSCRLDSKGEILRSGVGPTTSVYDNAIFDRQSDSAIIFNKAPNFYYDWATKTYKTNITKKEFLVSVKERVYQDKFLIDYNPINKNNTFPTPPVGWMTWYAVKFDACESVVLQNAEWLKNNLYDYGASSIWVDWEWYHSEIDTRNGPEHIHYFSPDPVRYPNGMKVVADKIEEMGLTPVLWIGVTHEPVLGDYMKKHSEMVLCKQPEWCGEYFYDFTNPTYLDKVLPDAIKKVKEWNYKGLKWDCLPVTQWVVDRYHEYLTDNQITTDKALKNVIKQAREILGDDFYMLSCAGSMDREVRFAMDVFDGARIGGDIFDWEEFKDNLVNRIMKFYPYHNVQIYCDPDNVVLREEFNTYNQAVSRATLVSVLGLPFTMGDDLTKLSKERVDVIKKCIPTLDAHPLDLQENSLKGDIFVVNQQIAKEFEGWNIVSILNLKNNPTTHKVLLKDLCLEKGDYLVYEFWNNEFVGIVSNEFISELDACESKVYAIRKLTGEPQVVSTSRHLSQGGVDLVSVVYDKEENTLKGVSNVIKGDSYVITAYNPTTNKIIKKEILPTKTGEITWEIKF